MSISIGIVAHQKRENEADQLAKQTQPLLMSVDTGKMGATTNHLFVWQQLAKEHTTWAVVLEDDAQPIPNFRHHLTSTLEAAPAAVVSLYLGRTRPPQYQQRITEALDKADANNAHWITATQLLHAVAVAIRTELIPDMLANHKPYLPIDESIGRWSRKQGHPIAYTVPSLVNHNDTIPTLITHRDDQPRTPGRVAHRTGTHTVWNSNTVEL